MITATAELVNKSNRLKSPGNLAKKIFDSCDRKRSGKITKEEFVNG
jgi:Ca2+-binding EF-hand superfamily protein